MKKVLVVMLCGLCFTLLSCAQEETVDDIIAKMTEANGGAEALMAINDRVGTWEMKMAMPDPETGEMTDMTTEMVITYKRPNKLRFDVFGPDGSPMGVSCYDGETGWQSELDPQTMAMNTKTMSEVELQETENMAATWLDGFQNYKERGTTITKLPTEEGAGDGGGRISEHILLECAYKNGHTETLYVNPASYFVEKSMAMRMNPATQAMEELLMTFGDYQMLEGVAIPHVVAMHTKDGGTTLWSVTFKDAKHNTGVDDDLFTMNGMTAK